jgi:hypothetical protein
MPWSAAVQRFLGGHIQRQVSTRLRGIELVENLVEDRFLRALEQSGFIDNLLASYGVR